MPDLVAARQFPRRLALQAVVAAGASAALGTPRGALSALPDLLTPSDWTYLSNATQFYRAVAAPLAAVAQADVPAEMRTLAAETGRFVLAQIRSTTELLASAGGGDLRRQGVVPAGENRVYPLPPQLRVVPTGPQTAAWATEVLDRTGLALSMVDDWTDGYATTARPSSRQVDAHLLEGMRALPGRIADVFATLGKTPPPLSDTSGRLGTRSYPAASSAAPVPATRRELAAALVGGARR